MAIIDLRAHFGTRSTTTRKAVSTLYRIVSRTGTTRMKPLLDSWKTLVGKVCGYEASEAGTKLAQLGQCYGISEPQPEVLLFTIHTYYALLMKLLAAKGLSVISHPGPAKLGRCAQPKSNGQIYEMMRHLERTGIWQRRGVSDKSGKAIFCWYLDAWDERVADVIRDILRTISRYDASTLCGEPGQSRDLFKRIYHHLLPKSVRHGLGEYYTPDWLAHHVLNEVGYDGDPDQRLLDPACGSGTFLVMAINRIVRWFAEHRHECGYGKKGLAERILANVIGFDLNPLAVMAARTNYLLALRGLLGSTSPQEVPVHLCDCVMDPVPIDRVDLVVGNPPWINWQYLPTAYRKATAPLWQQYGLFPHKGYRARLGAGKDDISMLMAYAAHDTYLKEDGKLGFVITQSVFKTRGGGEGFRKLSYDRSGVHYYMPVIRVHDLSDIRPFEDASNAAAVLTVAKARKPFKYPVAYVKWRRKRGSAVSEDMSLEEVIGVTTRRQLLARPVEPGKPASPWLTVPRGTLAAIRKVIGESPYRARVGCCTWLNGAFWLRILGTCEDGSLLVENLHGVGRTKIPKVEASIEPDLVYPLLRGRDIGRWTATPSAYMILPNRVDRLAGIPEDEMKARYPKTFAYLKEFEPQLRRRPGLRRYLEPDAPFYAIYNVGPYTLAPLRVLWRQFLPKPGMALLAKASDRFLGAKLPLTQHVVTFTSLDCADEALFFAACGNSSPAGLLHRSASTGKSYGQPHILRMIGIPRYDPADSRHRRLATLAGRCHEAAEAGAQDAIADLELEIDHLAAAMWGITPEELRSMRRSFSA